MFRPPDTRPQDGTDRHAIFSHQSLLFSQLLKRKNAAKVKPRKRERERDSRTVSTNKVPSPSHGINACVHQPFENYLVHSVEGVLLGRQIHRPQISTSRSNLDTRKAPTRPAYATRNELHVTRGAVIEPERWLW